MEYTEQPGRDPDDEAWATESWYIPLEAGGIGTLDALVVAGVERYITALRGNEFESLGRLLTGYGWMDERLEPLVHQLDGTSTMTVSTIVRVLDWLRIPARDIKRGVEILLPESVATTRRDDMSYTPFARPPKEGVWVHSKPLCGVCSRI